MANPIKNITDIDCFRKTVLVRVDVNVAIFQGIITSDARIKAIIPTIEYLLQQEAAIILISHLGRPIEGVVDANLSLKKLVPFIEKYLNKPVRFAEDWLNGVQVSCGEIVLCENVRFNIGEEANDISLAQKMAALCDIFVMDAFGTAHRAQASTVGVARFAKQRVAGLLLKAELDALSKALEKPKSPVVAIVGGAKVSSKLNILYKILPLIDTLIVGGGIANTFLYAAGHAIGESLFEISLVAEAKKLLAEAARLEKTILLPVDVVVAPDIQATELSQVRELSAIEEKDKIFDVGPKSSEKYNAVLQKAQTIIWNGPLGVFEVEAFGKGTQRVAEAIASSHAFSLAGGGETLAAIEKYQVAQAISYISTGGGAFLEYIEGKILPGVAILSG